MYCIDVLLSRSVDVSASLLPTTESTDQTPAAVWVNHEGESFASRVPRRDLLPCEENGARLVIDWTRVLANLGIHEDRAEQHEVAELRMDDVAMDAHVSQAGRYRHRLVGDGPHLGAPAIGLHGKSSGAAIHCANPFFFQCGRNSTPDVVDLVGRVVKLYVGNRPRRRTDVLTIHLEDEADQGLCRREQ